MRLFKRKKYYQLSPEKQIAQPYDQDGLYSIHNHDFMGDPAFRSAYARSIAAVGDDFRNHWRMRTALWAARTAAHLTGDYIECGVGFGAVSSAILHDVDWSGRNSLFYLIDTFAGIDIAQTTDEEEQTGAFKLNRKNLETRKYNTSLERACMNFAEWPHARVIQGTVPTVFSEIKTDRFAFAHIDMNAAAPEAAALEWLWPRMTAGGIILFDDFVFHGYEAQTAALRLVARNLGVEILEAPTGQGLLIKTP